jgi:uncharacterized membrane protein YcaP (DUF421 family)
VEARPTVLVCRGGLIGDHLDRERIAPEDIFSSMHKVGLERLDQVEWAILEGDGKIALIPRPDAWHIAADGSRRIVNAAQGGGSPIDG